MMEEIYVVKVRTKPDAARLYPSERRYSALTVGGLGAVHLVLGATSLLLGILGLVLQEQDDCWTTRYGGGLWLGMFALTAGAAGMLAWRRWYVDNNIRWFFASCTISGTASLVCLIVTAAALAAIQEQRSRHNFIYYDQGVVKHLPNGFHSLSPPAPLNLLQTVEQQGLSSTENPTIEHSQQWEENQSVRSLDEETLTNHNRENESNVNRFTNGDNTEVIKEQTSLAPDTTWNPPSYIMHIDNIHADDIQTTAASKFTRRKKSAQTQMSASQEESLGANIQLFQNKSEQTQQKETASHQLDSDMTLHPGEDEDSYIVKEDVPPSLHQIRGVSAGREVRTVVAINILVASALELAWSLLSASIAWKGMRNRYNEDAPNGDVVVDRARTVEGVERSPPPPPPPSSDAYSKHDGEKQSMEEFFRKPDIISNHHRRHFSRVAGNNERNNRHVISTVSERIDHFLPMQESTMEYQERVHRFLASNNLAAPSDTASNIDST